MTAIAGIACDGTVWIGGDSAGVDGWSLTVRSDPKVFYVGKFVIGYTSSFRMGQVLRYSDALRAMQPCRDLFECMVTKFVPAIRHEFKEAGCLQVKDSVEGCGDFLVGVEGQLFRVEGDFQVGVSECGFDAVGCGRDLCLGSLHSTRDLTLPPKERLMRALSTAEAFSAGVCGPFDIKST